MIEQQSGKSFPLYCVQAHGNCPTHAVATLVLMMDDDEWSFEHLCPVNNATMTNQCLAVSSMLKNQTSDSLQKAAVYGVINGVQLVDVSTNMACVIENNTETLVSSVPCMLGKIIISESATDGVIALYDDSVTTNASSFVGKFNANTRSIFDVKHTFSNGLCVRTTGTANVNVSILYRVSP